MGKNYGICRYDFYRYDKLRNEKFRDTLLSLMTNKIHIREYFPLGKAYGEAFCNRVKETEWLVGNLIGSKHSLLLAPRRYGKSSLAEKAINQAKLPFIKINFHLTTSENEIRQLIVNAVIKLIGKSVGQVEKIITSIKKYVSNLTPKLSFGNNLATLELVPKQDINNAVVIVEALLLLDNLLKEKGEKAVIFFDEFQEISRVAKNTNIEGAIRTAAQETQHLLIIFSGSIRSLLMRMFDDENRPLYKLCRKLHLDRISAQDYEQHLNKFSLVTWGKNLPADVFNAIMGYSNRHPYYVNYLCDIIWENNKLLPNQQAVSNAWEIVVTEERADAIKELYQISVVARRILKYILNNEVKHISSQETSMALGLPISTITSALASLIDKDYVETTAEGIYKIINPLLSAVLHDSEIL